MAVIEVDPAVCTSCGACIVLCSSAAVYAEVEGRVQAVAPQQCWDCGHCVAACPVDAIRHSDFALDDCPLVDRAILPAIEGLVMAFRSRRSARVFLDRPVPRTLVRRLVDIARWAPTAGNRQPVDWLAFDDSRQIAALSAGTVAALNTPQNGAKVDPDYERLAQSQEAGEDPIFFRAPVLLVAMVPDEAAAFGRDDAAYAAYNLMLAAEGAGLGTCLIGYFIGALARDQGLRTLLGLPAGHRAEVALVLGYPRYRFRRAVPRRLMRILWNGSTEG
jgi:nitroreductase/NAD-dependent dihydropyrimidine dehydrogenase PreA subunit